MRLPAYRFRDMEKIVEDIINSNMPFIIFIPDENIMEIGYALEHSKDQDPTNFSWKLRCLRSYSDDYEEEFKSVSDNLRYIEQYISKEQIRRKEVGPLIA